ncbi:hypothetical protein N7456_009942 [Penicillium angulare]|uniref:Uncharacterized protein n=1 Tax=Penicillium angulare TaxID=116970 RepID=A0A9W9K678_9EURO|nr:hypothetical protein N7456_009942 [Penicillium angulare]
MSTSQGDRISLARHNYPQSPFNRARDPNYEFDLDTSNFPTPSKQNGSRSHHSYRTSTLAGAYRAASRASMEEGIQPGSSPSPRQARRPFGAFSPNSETSNPRVEAMDVYRGAEEYDIQPNNALLGEWDAPRGARSASYSSSHTRNRDYEHVAHDGLAISEVSLFSENGAYSPRRRTADYTKDEQRLRRVTGKDSPVFSKAKTGRAALTADNLQRREEEEAESQHISDDDNERGPSLNLPTTWGSRANRRQEWLRNVSQRSVSDESKEREERPPKGPEVTSEPKTRSNETLTSKRRPSPRSLERNHIPTRSALEERTANPHIQDIPEPREEPNERKFSPEQAAPGEGDPIPNTPIVVFKNSNFTKQNQPKRDSQNLLRLLSRTESPKLEQTQTPEPPKLFERQIYDKTPRVTGAWIDTPMTAKVAPIPDDLTNDIVVPKVVEAPKQQIQPPAEVETKSKDLNKRPIPTKENSPEEEKPARQSRSSVLRPRLPKSGLETVIEDVNSGKETLDLGDDTIESLQAIINDQIDLKTEEEEEAAYEKEVLAKLQLARSNGQSSVDMDRLDDKLASLANKINEMKDGLAKLEGNISPDGSATPQSKPSAEKKPQRTTRPQTSEACEQCALHPHGRVYAAIPLPQLWIRNPSTRRRQLTKLGWVTFVSLTWYVIECMMEEQYSHPTVAETCDGYCLMPDAPEFPFVTVTMLWRWSHLSVILMPILTAAMAIVRLVGLLLGLWDGFVDEPTEIGSLVGEVRINGTPVAFPWLSSPSAQGVSQGLPPPQPPVWTPRDEPPRNEPPHNQAPVKWDDDQPSMDDDEFI